MIIRCYGARGSIPVSGEEYVKYGGNTTCLEIRTGSGEIIIVDAGTGIRPLGNKLIAEERFEYNILFTHSHMDHIIGFPFFRPIYDKRATIHMMGCPTAQGNIQKLLSKAMSAPLFPIRFDDLRADIRYSDDCPYRMFIGSVEIYHVNLSHPNIGLGYRFVEDGKAFVFLTDNELGYRHRGGSTFEEYVAFARDADLLIHDAEYLPGEYEMTRSWGHSNYMDALNLALEARVHSLGLFHHNQNRSDADQDGVVRMCRDFIEAKGVPMSCFAFTQTTELTL